MERDQALLFQELKPVCVKLSQIALLKKAGEVDSKELVRSVQELFSVLEKAKRLTPKLSDYVFFPLSKLLQNLKALPPRASALLFKCLSVLVSKGWNTSIEQDLCKQLLILFGHVLASGDGQSESGFPEDVRTAVLGSLAALLTSSQPTVRKLLSNEDHKASNLLGTLLSYGLGSLREAKTAETQGAGADVVYAFLACFQKDRILLKFFPGIVSNISASLTPKAGVQKYHHTIVKALKCLELAFKSVLGGELTQDTEKWATANQSQMLQALANVTKLRSHGKPDVKSALFELCSTILVHCRKILAPSEKPMMETLVYLCSGAENGPDDLEHKLNAVLRTSSEISDVLQLLSYEWMTSLPKLLSFVDTQKFEIQTRMTSVSLNALAALGLEGDSLNEHFLECLQNCLGIALQESSMASKSSLSKQSIEIEQPEMLFSGELIRTSELELKSPEDGRLKALRSMVHGLNLRPLSKVLLSLKERLATTSYHEKLPLLWLISQVYSTSSTPLSSAEDLATENQELSSLLDEAYHDALTVLAYHPDSDQKRLQLEGVALDIVGIEAKRIGQSFRGEMIDVLYPVIERLAGAQSDLQLHAARCLNSILQGCSIKSPQELVLQNADYLINAVSLRFNSLDLTPQAVRVLEVIIKICGSHIIPYMDDILGSVFSNLDLFHGYPRLVEGLMSILGTVLRVTSENWSRKSLKIEEEDESSHEERSQPSLLQNFLRGLSGCREPSSIQNGDWEGLKGNLSSDNDEAEPKRELSHQDDEPTPQPGWQIKTSRSIVAIGQHYLTSESMALRKYLLDLMPLGLDVVASDENILLPLVNEIWPVVLDRIHDEETTIKISALKAITCIADLAGTFLVSRVEAAWPDLLAVIRPLTTYKRAPKGRDSWEKSIVTSSGYGMLVDAHLEMLEVLITKVGLSPSMEDDVFDLLVPLGLGKSKVDTVLSLANPDYFWFVSEQA